MRIGHYAPEIRAPGGIATYIRNVGAAQTGAGHTVFYLGKTAYVQKDAEDFIVVETAVDLVGEARRLNLDVLHLHKPVPGLLAEDVTIVRTMHGHQGSCPSGTRYLSRWKQPCDRAYSVTGCLWGHLVDRCGSRNPQRIQSNFRRFHEEVRQGREIHTYTVSKFLMEQMIRSGYPSDRLYTIASPSPPVEGDFAPLLQEAAPRFVFMGRMVPQKGLEWLLRAIAVVKPTVLLDVAGDGPIREDMQRLALQLGIGERVTFHKWLNPDALRHLIWAARAVVFPSVWHEPAGLVSLEAAAHGRAVIAGDVGGIPEYATDAYALRVPPNDIDGLAAAIKCLAEDATLAEQMGRKGMQLARTDFSMSRFLNSLDSFYAIASGKETEVVH